MITTLPDSITLPDNFWDQADHFVSLLLQWNKTHKVTGIKSVEQARDHIIDSLYPLSFLDPFSKVLDIGSGAGLPALPLALARPQAHFWLAEPLQKRFSFLSLVSVELGLTNITVLPKRIEHVPPFEVDLITSRAVAHAQTLIDLSGEFISPATTILLYKGEKTANEADALSSTSYCFDERTYLVLKGEHCVA